MPSSGRKVIILDTTLRDGTQSPGFDMTRQDKVAVASSLDKLGIDIIEAGFPASSSGQFDDVCAIAESLETSAVSVMARATEADIKLAGRAIRNARQSYIHTSIPISPIHRKYKLKKSISVILDMAVDAVLYALELADFVEIGAEDATRTEYEVLAEFCTMVTDAGAAVVNIADTAGYVQPQEFYKIISRLHGDVKAFREGKARISVHCHNDLGMAAANTLAGLSAGAGQAEVTLLGLGERAGNAPLEEVIMSLIARSDYYNGMYTGVNPSCFAVTARKIASFTGVPPSPVKAVAGRNACCHAAGLHQDGVLVEPSTYSLVPSSVFGYSTGIIKLSRHSGTAGLISRLKEINGGVEKVPDETELFNKFKQFADGKQTITSTDIISFFINAGLVQSRLWKIVSCVYSVRSDADTPVRIKIKMLSNDGMIKKLSASGVETNETLMRLLLSAFRLELEIVEYSFTSAGYENRYSGRCYLVLRYEGEDYGEETAGHDNVNIMAECFTSIINRISGKYRIEVR